MKFVTIRDFRSRSAKIQKQLPKQGEMVLTSNGKPIAILSAVSEDTMEDSLAAFRRSRAIAAVISMQQAAYDAGKDQMSVNEINKEIASVRKRRKR